jgi:hypothetical protein
MTQIMVRYKVWPDHVAANVELVRAVYDELHRSAPDGLSYATFQLDDGVSFIHLHSDASPDGDRLGHVAAFADFQDGIAQRCEEAPVVTQLREVGSYRFGGG